MSNPALQRVVQGAQGSQAQPGFSAPGSNVGPGTAYGQPGQAPYGAGYQQWNTPGAQPGYPQGAYPQPGYGQPAGYQQPAPQIPAQGYMTMDDVVIKTGVSLFAVIASAVATWILFSPPAGSTDYSKVIAVAIGGALVGFVLAMVNSFKRSPNAVMVLLYCIAEGAFLGGISGIFEIRYPGIVVQAVLGTMGVFIGMLIVYRTGAIRVTPKFQRWLAAAVMGVLVLMMFNLIYFLITGHLTSLRNGGPLAIGFSLLCIAIAAFTFLSDFDLADQAIRRGAPKNFAWGIAFGLIASIVWLYVEILRLLSYLRN